MNILKNKQTDVQCLCRHALLRQSIALVLCGGDVYVYVSVFVLYVCLKCWCVSWGGTWWLGERNCTWLCKSWFGWYELKSQTSQVFTVCEWAILSDAFLLKNCDLSSEEKQTENLAGLICVNMFFPVQSSDSKNMMWPQKVEEKQRDGTFFRLFLHWKHACFPVVLAALLLEIS